MLDVAPLPQVGLYLFQILLHSGAVASFGQLVFQIALVVYHVREEALAHVGVSGDGGQCDNQNEECHGPSVA